MPLFAFHAVDLGVLLLYLAAMLTIGFYFRHEQRTSRDFFLAGRTMSWLPVGLSVAVALLPGWTFAGIASEAYGAGLKYIVLPVAICLIAPLMLTLVLPVYRGFELTSVYEYLELRFDSKTRLAGSLLYVAWRLLWMVGMLCVSCRMLTVAANLAIPSWLLILIAGLIATLYTFLGGMKAILWADGLRALVMLSSVLAMIAGAWWHLAGGPSRVWQVATALDRSTLVDTEFRWNSIWTVWGVVPHLVLSLLSFYVADQITTQRLFAAQTLRQAQRSFLLNCIFASILVSGLSYLGICLLAFYHDHPEALRTRWIVNVDGETRRSMTYADRDRILGEPSSAADSRQPLLKWNEPLDEITAESIERLVAERRVLQPNRKTPFENAEELLDPRRPDRVDVEQLAMRQPPKAGLKRGEVVLNVQAKNELIPWFMATQLPFGVAGLVVAGLLGAIMSAMDSGLNSVCTLMVIDFHRRFGWGRRWLALRMQKPAGELNEVDELRVARPLTLVVGAATTLFAVAIGELGDSWGSLLNIVNSCGASLLGVFLLGLLTRRANASAACLALVSGTLFTAWLVVANSVVTFAWLWPFGVRLSSLWPVTLGTLFTIVVGYGASFACGQSKERSGLRGLTLGCGPLGVRAK